MCAESNASTSGSRFARNRATSSSFPMLPVATIEAGHHASVRPVRRHRSGFSPAATPDAHQRPGTAERRQGTDTVRGRSRSAAEAHSDPGAGAAGVTVSGRSNRNTDEAHDRRQPQTNTDLAPIGGAMQGPIPDAQRPDLDAQPRPFDATGTGTHEPRHRESNARGADRRPYAANSRAAFPRYRTGHRHEAAETITGDADVRR